MNATQFLSGVLAALTLSSSAGSFPPPDTDTRLTMMSDRLTGELGGSFPPPGTGTRLTQLGDNFEETDWTYNFNNPKLYNEFETSGSSFVERILNANNPRGTSANGRWMEGPTRGHPDIVERVPTPRRGPSGSRHALRLQTRNSGTPNRTEGTLQQDDLLNVVPGKTQADIPLGEGLSVVTRIYLPPLREWEDRKGYHIGFRVGASGRKNNNLQDYWPGIWIWMDKDEKGDRYFRFSVRANDKGEDTMASETRFTRTGWWTLGMAFNRDGSISYYASPGTDDLTSSDLLTYRANSQTVIATYRSYGITFENLDYLFFSMASIDGEWSTEFIVDDVAAYSVSP